jgi:hypothetical protein
VLSSQSAGPLGLDIRQVQDLLPLSLLPTMKSV